MVVDSYFLIEFPGAFLAVESVFFGYEPFLQRRRQRDGLVGRAGLVNPLYRLEPLQPDGPGRYGQDPAGLRVLHYGHAQVRAVLFRGSPYGLLGEILDVLVYGQAQVARARVLFLLVLEDDPAAGVAYDLAPAYAPGEHLVVDQLKAGQAAVLAGNAYEVARQVARRIIPVLHGFQLHPPQLQRFYRLAGGPVQVLLYGYEVLRFAVLLSERGRQGKYPGKRRDGRGRVLKVLLEEAGVPGHYGFGQEFPSRVENAAARAYFGNGAVEFPRGSIRQLFVAHRLQPEKPAADQQSREPGRDRAEIDSCF